MLDDETIAMFAVKLSQGLARKHCAALSGLGGGKLGRYVALGQEWLRRASDGFSATTDHQALCMALVDAMELAEAKHAEAELSAIKGQAAPQLLWKILQSRYPELYGEIRRLEVSADIETRNEVSFADTCKGLGLAYEGE